MSVETTVMAMGVVFGLLGGLLYPLMQNIGWKDKLSWWKHLIYGAVAGFFVALFNVTLVIDNFNPDLPWASMLVIVAPLALTAGYFGIDVIRAILKKYKPEPETPQPPTQ